MSSPSAPITAPMAVAASVRVGRHVAVDPRDAVAEGLGRPRLDQMVEPGSARRWGPSDFEAGDLVRCFDGWREVLLVGPVGLTVRLRRPRDGADWDVPVQYGRITGRRRQGVEITDAA
ncbi:hypothetical protein [Kineosporia babensis]|uniref:Uncharacterized protein n=1 Tax=Kineosporia babensis TaxID=499548 RepID=A0A9X1NG39_9ACTN|nr:hypothetical protein [Kineosporia babensis]MCD5313290.1 hypothetical protein [Kineosporia babensis]